MQARFQRGGAGVRTPSPLRFAKVGVLCRGLVGRRGGPTVDFTLLSFFSGSLCSPVLHAKAYMLPSSMFSMERSSFLYISHIQIMKRIQLPTPCFNERAFSYCSCPELHNFTPFKQKKILGEDPQTPLSDTFTISELPCHLCVYVERGLQSYKRLCPTEKKT